MSFEWVLLLLECVEKFFLCEWQCLASISVLFRESDSLRIIAQLCGVSLLWAWQSNRYWQRWSESSRCSLFWRSCKNMMSPLFSASSSLTISPKMFSGYVNLTCDIHLLVEEVVPKLESELKYMLRCPQGQKIFSQAVIIQTKCRFLNKLYEWRGNLC